MTNEPSSTSEIAALTAERHVELSLFPDIKPDRPVGYIVPSVFVGSNGLASGNARLTDEQVAEIRARYKRNAHPSRGSGCSVSELAAEFGVTKQYVWQLAVGLWRQEATQ